MKNLRKSVDMVVLCLLYLLGSAFLALGALAWRPIGAALGHPPRPVIGEPQDLTRVINSAFVFIALSTLVGTWIVRLW